MRQARRENILYCMLTVFTFGEVRLVTVNVIRDPKYRLTLNS